MAANTFEQFIKKECGVKSINDITIGQAFIESYRRCWKTALKSNTCPKCSSKKTYTNNDIAIIDDLFTCADDLNDYKEPWSRLKKALEKEALKTEPATKKTSSSKL